MVFPMLALAVACSGGIDDGPGTSAAPAGAGSGGAGANTAFGGAGRSMSGSGANNTGGNTSASAGRDAPGRGDGGPSNNPDGGVATDSGSGGPVTDPEPEPDPNPRPATTVTRHEFTWTFDDEYQVGQYANGDYWVVGPVRIVAISPESTEDGDRVMNGSMVNPTPGPGRQGYDSSMNETRWDAALNVALGVSESNPLELEPGTSLISSQSVAAAGNRPQLQSAGVLTVVAEAVPPGTFRPPYSGTDKTHKFSIRDIDWSKLPSLATPGSAPDFTRAEGWFDRPWLDHIGGWQGRECHPSRSMPDYGRDLASRLGEGALLLLTEGTQEEKADLLYDYIQVGIDFQGIIDGGATDNWVPNGGHAQGRKWPILFAGLMLGDERMSAIGSNDEVHFGEDDQTFYVEETGGEINNGHGGYTAADVGLPEWGIRHATENDEDDSDWRAQYRVCCTANSWAGHVLAALIMDARDDWNHEALFDYTDRFMAMEQADSDFTQDMWDTFREDYGDVWSSE